MVALSSLGGAGWQFFDNNGRPLSGGKLYTYQAGTTTPATTYTSSTGGTPNTNPIILDPAGRIPEEVWLTSAANYKFVLKNVFGVEIWTKDNLPGIINASQLDVFGAFINTLSLLSTTTIPSNVSAVTTAGYSAVGTGAGLYVADSLANASLAASHPRFCKADAAGRYFRLYLANGTANVDQGGAAGDGTTDDHAPITATYAYVKAVGGDTVEFSGAKSYRVATEIACGNNIIWNFNGATIKCSTSVAVFGNDYGTSTAVAYVLDDIVGPSNQIKVDTPDALAVGDVVIVQVGYNPWDNAEPYWGSTCEVLAVDTGTGIVTLDATISRSVYLNQAWTYTTDAGVAISVPAVAASNRCRSVRKLVNGYNVTVNNFRFYGDTAAGVSVEAAMYFQGGRRITINNAVGNPDGVGDSGAGLVNLQFCRDVVINDPRLYYNKNGRNQASMGRMLSFSNCINVQVSNPVGRGLEGYFAFTESFCENVVLQNPIVDICANARANVVAFFAGQSSEMLVQDPTVYTYSGTKTWLYSDSGGTENTFVTQGVVKFRGSLPKSIVVNGDMLIDYDNPAAYTFTADIAATTLTTSPVVTGISVGSPLFAVGIAPGTTITADLGGGQYTVSVSQTLAAVSMTAREFCVVDFRDNKSIAMEVPLYTSMYEYYNLEGPVWGSMLYASAGVVAANVVGMYLGWDTNNGFNKASQLVAGSAVRVVNGQNFGIDYGGFKQLSGKGRLLVNHNATPPAKNSFVGLSANVAKVVVSSFLNAPPIMANPSAVAYSDAYMDEVLVGSKTMRGVTGSLTPGALGSGAQATLGTATVTGSAVGDYVTAVSPPAVTSGIQIWGEVTSANTVTVYAYNGTGGSLTPPAGVYAVIVRKI